MSSRSSCGMIPDHVYPPLPQQHRSRWFNGHLPRRNEQHTGSNPNTISAHIRTNRSDNRHPSVPCDNTADQYYRAGQTFGSTFVVTSPDLHALFPRSFLYAAGIALHCCVARVPPSDIIYSSLVLSMSPLDPSIKVVSQMNNRSGAKKSLHLPSELGSRPDSGASVPGAGAPVTGMPPPVGTGVNPGASYGASIAMVRDIR